MSEGVSCQRVCHVRGCVISEGVSYQRLCVISEGVPCIMCRVSCYHLHQNVIGFLSLCRFVFVIDGYQLATSIQGSTFVGAFFEETEGVWPWHLFDWDSD